MSGSIEKGTRIEHEGRSYTIGDELGSGSFGVVYLAQCDDNDLAIKKTKKKLDDNLTNQQFFDEIFCLQYNDHQAIPKFIAHFQRSGYGYLVMEYVEGQDLDAYASSDSITEQGLLRITNSVVDALQAMANRIPPILHYDLKPDNIRISHAGDTYLIDFGSIGIGKKRNPRTKTPGYSPPEQELSDEVDERGVIYALGATLFAILIDQNPPDPSAGRTDSADVLALLLAGGVSDGMAALVAHMMHPEREQRPQSFAELRTALDALIRRMPETSDARTRATATQRLAAPTRVRRAPTLPINGESTSPPPRRWIPLAGLGLASTLVLVGIALIFQSQLWVSPPNNPTNVVPTIIVTERPLPITIKPSDTPQLSPIVITPVLPAITIKPPTVTKSPSPTRRPVFKTVTPQKPTVAPTDALPIDVPPTDIPPTDAPPTDMPPIDVPPTDAPPTTPVFETVITLEPTVPPRHQQPTAAPPTAAPPTAAPPTAALPTAAPPTAAPPTAVPPTAAPPTAVPADNPKRHPYPYPYP